MTRLRTALAILLALFATAALAACGGDGGGDEDRAHQGKENRYGPSEKVFAREFFSPPPSKRLSIFSVAADRCRLPPLKKGD